MSFNSYSFLFLFFPVFFLVYRRIDVRLCAPLLCVGSLAFYAVGVWKVPWQLIPLVVITLLCVLGCAFFRKRSRRTKGLLALWIALTAAPLVCVKLSGLLPGRTLPLPLGLSFYTFQVISYFVDLYRGEIPPEDSIWRFALYLGMFPKIGAGPITSYKEIGKEIKERTISSENVQEGLGKLILGLVFKTQLADRLGALWNDLAVAGYESITWRYAWLGAVAFSLKLYFDFQGYSLMAIGLGQMLGFHLPENFRTPYLARSVRDFYRRWHATLGLWFRKYVYFPLGGSKRGEGRTILNLLAVWLLTGIWHGNTVNFLLWGIFLWCCIVLERLLEKIPFVKKMKVLPHLYLWFVIPISWMFFAITDVTQLQLFLCRMFGIGEAINENIMDWWVQLRRYGWILALGIFGASGLPEYACRKWKNNPIFNLVLAALFWLCVWSIMRQGSNPFQYLTF